MKLSHRDQLIVLVVVIVLVTVAAVFLLILPQFKEMGRLDGEIAKAEAEIAEARTLLSRRQEAKSSAAVTEAELLRLNNAVPESPELPSLIIELQDAANDSGLDFLRLAPAAELEEEEGGFNIASISLKITGRWADFVHFFQKLPKLNRQLRVTSIVVTPKAGTGTDAAAEDEEQLLDVAMTLEVYTIVGAGEAPAPAAPGAPTAAQ